MVRRTAEAPDTEPENIKFDIPSEKEHLLQIVDVYDRFYEQNKFKLDADTVIAKLEVVGGDEEGRSLLNRCCIDSKQKRFYFTRLMLKAISLQYKGHFTVDTDEWIGRQLYATVKHSDDGKYANIDEYNFEKVVENMEAKKKDEINWD